jgi:hypothetical protein
MLPEALTDSQIVGEAEGEPVVVALAHWLLLGQAEALGLREAEGLEDTEPLGERVPLAQPLALALAVAPAEALVVVLGCTVGDELLQAVPVVETQDEGTVVALGDELALEQAKEVRDAEGDMVPLALVLGVGLALALAV